MARIAGNSTGRTASSFIAAATAFITLSSSAPTRSQTPAAALYQAAATPGAPRLSAPQFAKNYGNLPLIFEANQGQADPAVKYLSRGNRHTLLLTADGAVIERAGLKAVLRMRLVGSNLQSMARGAKELPGKANYFAGRDPARWRTNVPTYAAVKYEEVYPGVDLIYYGNQSGQLEYDFVVAPGGDPMAIKLNVATDLVPGGAPMRLDASGDLVVHAKGGVIRLLRPVAYQEDGEGRRQSVDGRYVLGVGTSGTRGQSSTLSFDVASYDRSRPLVIDPVLAYSTFVGASDPGEGSNGIAIDSAGNAYITGSPASVTKLNASGTAVIYSTYLGGALARGIAVDGSGNAYVTGYTGDAAFPTTPGAFQPAHAGRMDAFVSRLDSSGALLYSTLLGGDGYEFGTAIAVDNLGNAYVTFQGGAWGYGGASVPPTTPGAYMTAVSCCGDHAGVAKLNPTGTALVYSTLLGGNHNDGISGIAVDTAGNAYVTGWTYSSNFHKPGAFQTTNVQGTQSAYVTKINAAGSALLYSTYLNGGSNDVGLGIALGPTAIAYVTGFTFSANFPTTTGAYQTVLRGQRNAFVTALNGTGTALIYSTYLGGSDNDWGNGVALDSSGNAYVAGYTYATDFPTTPDAHQSLKAGGADAFVSKLDATGSALLYSTYLGGASDDMGNGIAVDNARRAYITGNTGSVAFPTTSGAYQTVKSGGNDAFVAKIGTDSEPPSVSCESADGVWHAADVALACTASDSGSGLLVAADATFVLSTHQAPATSSSNAETDSHQVCDVAGNCFTAGPIGGNKIDKRAPTIDIRAPLNANYLLHETISVAFECVDGGSGLSSCTGSGVNGAPLDTSTPGVHTLSVTATDAVGNSATSSVSYSVLGAPTAPVRQVSAGGRHTCALKADGSVVCWGEPFTGKLTPPAGLVAVQLSGGQNHNCAVSADGTVSCWGDNSRGQTTVPPGLIARQVSAGVAHTCAVTAVGNVVCWGMTPPGIDKGQATVPDGLSGVASVIAGLDHSCAMKVDGTVVCWGSNFNDQLQIPGGLNATQLSGRYLHTCAQRTDKSLACWGYYRLAALPAGGVVAEQVSAGGSHTCAVRPDASVRCWGFDGADRPEAQADFGQTIVPSDLAAAAQVSAGHFHTCALATSGTVVCWGRNVEGQTEVPIDLKPPVPPTPVPAESIERWRVSNGFYTLAAFGDGTLLAAGGNTGGTMDPRTGATLRAFPADLRMSIRLSTGDQDYAVGGYQGRTAYRQDGSVVRTLMEYLGCCNIPRYPMAIDPSRDQAYVLANHELFGANMSTGDLSYHVYGAGDFVGMISIADPETLYTSGRDGSVTRVHPVNGRQWIVSIDTGRLEPGAVAEDGSFVVTSRGAHLGSAIEPGRLARIHPNGTVAWNHLVNAVTPPVIGRNGVVYVGTQAPPVSENGAGAIEAYDLDTGHLVWRTVVAGLPNDLLIGDDGAVYAGAGSAPSARVYALGQTDGAIRKTITNLPGAWEIILRGGLLYTTGTAMTALPVDAVNYDPGAPWPVRFHDNQRTGNRRAPLLSAPRDNGNTIVGSEVNVIAPATLPGGSPAVITLTFDQVTAPGQTSVTASTSGAPPPAGFKLTSPPVYYDITTSAVFAGRVRVCLSWSEGQVTDENNVRLFHNEGGQWVDITDLSSRNPVANVVCGTAASLSPFTLFEADPPPDQLAPSVVCAAADGIWRQSDASLACTASDDGSGLLDASDADFSLTTSVAAGEETASAPTNSRTVCDVAGNCTTVGPLGGNTIDKKAPTVSITTPANGSYLLNQAATAAFGCADGGSGVSSCMGPVANGAQVQTGAVGSHTFSVTATDTVGNDSSSSVTYQVGYNQCLLFDPTKSYKAGSTIPIKLKLCDAAGVNVSNASVSLMATGVYLVSTSAPGPLADSGNANPDHQFRFTDSSYIFNLSLKGFSQGTYALSFTVLNDPTPHVVQFQVK